MATFVLIVRNPFSHWALSSIGVDPQDGIMAPKEFVKAISVIVHLEKLNLYPHRRQYYLKREIRHG